MGFDEHLQLSDLLAPIPGESPIGPDLKYSNEFNAIELDHHLGTDPPLDRQTNEPDPKAEDAFPRIAEAASDFLRTQSKDLRIAAFLASALLRVGIGPLDDDEGARSFRGLAFGFDLLRAMMEQFWDEMHPGVDSRWACLAALGSEDLKYPILRVPLTSWGHNQVHFSRLRVGEDNEWSDPDPSHDPGEEGLPWSGNFPEAFEETDREYYVALSEELGKCTSALESLEEVGRERFGEAGESPPSYREVKEALRDVSRAVSELLARKPAPVAAEAVPPPQEAEVPAAPEGAEPNADVSGAAAHESQGTGPPTPTPSPPPRPVSSEPRDAGEAAAAVAAAARFLRKEDPKNPIPYLLLRSLRWGEVRGTEDRIDPEILEAPEPEDRKRLRGLFLKEQWSELLAAGEEIMASEAGRGWLDLQRYAILSADHLGAEFKAVTAALRGVLRTHLQDMPSLSAAVLMDDSAAASADTLQWLETAGFISPEEGASDGGPLPDDTDPDRVRREASFSRARQMVQAGDPSGAIELLTGRADRENSERASFITKVEAARIMVDRGETSVARPILDELHREIEEHKLDDWESGEVVAKPLSLLIRCLGPSEGALRQQIYERICTLDPLLARDLGDGNDGE